jgi:hypothetical protein
MENRNFITSDAARSEHNHAVTTAKNACTGVIEQMVDELRPCGPSITLGRERSMSSILTRCAGLQRQMYPVIAKILHLITRRDPEIISLDDILDEPTRSLVRLSADKDDYLGIVMALAKHVERLNDVIRKHREYGLGNITSANLYLFGLTVGQLVYNAVVHAASKPGCFDLYVDNGDGLPTAKSIANQLMKKIGSYENTSQQAEEIATNKVYEWLDTLVIANHHTQEIKRHLSDGEKNLFMAGFYPHGIAGCLDWVDYFWASMESDDEIFNQEIPQIEYLV